MRQSASVLRMLIEKVKGPYPHNGSEMSQKSADVRRANDERALLLFVAERLLREMMTGCPMSSDGP